MRAIGYLRVSRVNGREGESFIAPDVYRKEIAQFADSRSDIDLVGYEEDLDQSGGTLDRPGLTRVIERVASGEIQAVIVPRINRLARSTYGGIGIWQEIESKGARVFSASENIDASTSDGRLHRGFLLNIAEYELDRYREQWDISNQSAIARGIHFTNRPPFGYDRGENGILIPNADAPLVREVFARRTARNSWQEIASFLNAKGAVPTPLKAGDPPSQWVPQTVRDIIKRRVYLGAAYHGKHVNEDAHPAIVTEIEWQAAQGERSTVSRRRTKNQEKHLLVGVVRCAGCCRALKPDTPPIKKTAKRGQRQPFYKCRRHHGAGDCPAPATITAKLVDDLVVESFLAVVGVLARSPEQSGSAITAALERLRVAEDRLARYRDDLDLQDSMSHDRFVDGVKIRAVDVDDAHAELDDARAKAGGLDLTQAIGLAETWPDLSYEEKRTLLGAAVDAVFVRRGGSGAKDRVRILWRGEGPDDLPRRGGRRRYPIASFDFDRNEVMAGMPVA